MDELDRILAEDEGLEPSSGFTRRVMDALQHEQKTPPPIPFPWLRMLPAFIGGLAVVVAFAFYFATEPVVSTPPIDVTAWLQHPLAGPLAWAALSLIGSWAAFRVSMRLAAPIR